MLITDDWLSRKCSGLALERDQGFVVESFVFVARGAVDVADLDVAFQVERRRGHCHAETLFALERFG